MSFTNPAPGARRGRVDEGVDWGGVTKTVAPAPGVITQIYYGLSGFATTIIERISGGRYTYTALETSGDTPTVHAGERVSAGQLTSSGGSGGGIEVGFWNPATGRAVAAPQYSYDGKPTAQGYAFRNAISGKGGVGTGTQSGNLSQLWVDAGGSPKLANIMAAIALAESGGNPQATNQNTNGSTDYGLWQINSVNVHGYNPQQLFDPLFNARQAVAIEKSQGLGAWTTYNTGAYKQFLGQHGRTYTFGRTRPGGAGSGGSGGGSNGPDQLLADYVALRDAPRTAPPSDSKASFQWWFSVFQDRTNKLLGG